MSFGTVVERVYGRQPKKITTKNAIRNNRRANDSDDSGCKQNDARDQVALCAPHYIYTHVRIPYIHIF